MHASHKSAELGLGLTPDQHYHHPGSSSNHNNISLTNQILSRSCSAPYKCTNTTTSTDITTDDIDRSAVKHLILTPPDSPPNEYTIKSAAEILSKTLAIDKPVFPIQKIQTTVYPVTMEFNTNKTGSIFSYHDSLMTARRQNSISKLKGLIIPEVPNNNNNNGDVAHSAPIVPNIKPEIALTSLIKSEAKDNEAVDVVHDEPNKAKPIEIIPLPPPTILAVPKYSPMFQRRPFTLPSNADISLGSTSTGNEMTTNKKTPPQTLPKPKEKIEEAKSLPPSPPIDIVETEKNFETEKNVENEKNFETEKNTEEHESAGEEVIFKHPPSDLGLILTSGFNSTNQQVTIVSLLLLMLEKNSN